MEVNKKLTPYGLQLYLYLASNSNDYRFALSPAAAEEYAGIRSTTFHKYLRLLEIEGYLVWRQGNVYDFYTTPRPADQRSHPDNHVDGIFFEDDDRETETVSPPNEVIPSPRGQAESATRKETPPDELPLSSRDPFSSPSIKEIDNRYIENNRDAETDKIDAGTPRTPDSHGADAPYSPPIERVIVIPPPVRKPKMNRI